MTLISGPSAHLSSSTRTAQIILGLLRHKPKGCFVVSPTSPFRRNEPPWRAGALLRGACNKYADPAALLPKQMGDCLPTVSASCRRRPLPSYLLPPTGRSGAFVLINPSVPACCPSRCEKHSVREFIHVRASMDGSWLGIMYSFSRIILSSAGNGSTVDNGGSRCGRQGTLRPYLVSPFCRWSHPLSISCFAKFVYRYEYVHYFMCIFQHLPQNLTSSLLHLSPSILLARPCRLYQSAAHCIVASLLQRVHGRLS